MSDELWKVLLTVLGATLGSTLLQLGAGYIARLRAPSQNNKDDSDAAAGIMRSAEQLRVLYEDQFKDQQKQIEELRQTNNRIQAAQLQNQRRILELESQDRYNTQTIGVLQKSDADKSTEIVSLRQELAAMYDYIGLIEKWAHEKNIDLPSKRRRADVQAEGYKP